MEKSNYYLKANSTKILGATSVHEMLGKSENERKGRKAFPSPKIPIKSEIIGILKQSGMKLVILVAQYTLCNYVPF